MLIGVVIVVRRTVALLAPSPAPANFPEAAAMDDQIPEDVKRLAVPVLSHRILMKERRMTRGESAPEARFIQRILNETPVPR